MASSETVLSPMKEIDGLQVIDKLEVINGFVNSQSGGFQDNRAPLFRDSEVPALWDWDRHCQEPGDGEFTFISR